MPPGKRGPHHLEPLVHRGEPLGELPQPQRCLGESDQQCGDVDPDLDAAEVLQRLSEVADGGRGVPAMQLDSALDVAQAGEPEAEAVLTRKVSPFPDDHDRVVQITPPHVDLCRQVETHREVAWIRLRARAYDRGPDGGQSPVGAAYEPQAPALRAVGPNHGILARDDAPKGGRVGSGDLRQWSRLRVPALPERGAGRQCRDAFSAPEALGCPRAAFARKRFPKCYVLRI